MELIGLIYLKKCSLLNVIRQRCILNDAGMGCKFKQMKLLEYMQLV